MDINFLLNPEVDIREQCNKQKSDDQFLVDNELYVYETIDKRELYGNEDRTDINNIKLKMSIVRYRLKKVMKKLKIINMISSNQFDNDINEILKNIPPIKIRKYTANEITTIIIYLIIKQKNYDITLNTLIETVKECVKSKSFSKSVKSLSNKNNILCTKNIIKYVESTKEENIETVEDLAKKYCTEFNYPEEIINNVLDLIKLAEKSMSNSIRKATIAASSVYIIVNKNYGGLTLSQISKASGVTPEPIRKAIKILSKLVEQI